MDAHAGQNGSVVQIDVPCWTPLMLRLPERRCSTYMWMHEVELQDGARLHAYKHSITRQYLHIGEDGSLWRYVAGRYVRISSGAGAALARRG